MDKRAKKEFFILFGIVLIAIGLMYLFFSLFLAKDMARLEDIKSEYVLQKTVSSYVQENRANLQDALEESSELLQFLEAKDMQKLLESYLAKYFLSYKLQHISSDTKEGIVHIRYFVQAVVNSPKDFYDFVEAMERKRIPVELDYPITFERAPMGIELRFFVEAYRVE